MRVSDYTRAILIDDAVYPFAKHNDKYTDKTEFIQF